MNNNHTWKFARIGGVNRVLLTSGADLANLGQLDQKLWTALSCPVNGLEIDPKTLAWIDSDGDGKIRVPEVLAAVNWIVSLINNPDDLISRPTVMPLSAINQNTPEGKQLYASAKEILRYLKKDSQELSAAETSDLERIFKGSSFNGDGIVGPNYTNDAALKAAINNIISAVGGSADRGGEVGIDSAALDTFVAAAQGYLDWQAQGESQAASLLPFGDKTAEAFALFSRLRAKIDDYFLRCRLAEFDPASAETLNSLQARIANISGSDIAQKMDEIATFPVAKIAANQALAFQNALNPAWRDDLLRFRHLIGNPAQLTENEWLAISNQLTAYGNWQAAKPSTNVESLGIDQLKAFLASDSEAKLRSLIDQDLALQDEAQNINLVDKLVRFYTQIYTLLCNFVSFSDFYNVKRKAIFQAGTLYFDQRACNLCVKVADAGKHSAMAANSAACLIYLDCTSKKKGEKMTIVAALTDGDIDNLIVGRNAVFYDNDGLDWDATVVKIIENPISIRQAFWTPYRKMGQLIAAQVEKIAAAQDAKVSAATTSGIEAASTKANTALAESIKPTDPKPADAPPPAPEPPKPEAPKAEAPKNTAFDIAKFAGIFAAIGLAIGAIGTAITSIIQGFLALPLWMMPLVILAIILVISGPSMVLAWMKLRKRNLAPILDANGWAINAKATINISFGAALTDLATLPANAHLNINDPFRNKQSPMLWISLVAIVLAIVVGSLWYYGYLHQWGILGS